MDNLQRYQFNQLLLNTLIEQQSPDPLFNRLRAAGGLPFGAFGEVYWLKQQKEMQPLADKIREQQMETFSVDLHHDLGQVILTGRINKVQPDGLLRWRPASLTANDGMQLWIEHLAYCLAGGKGESRSYGRDNSEWCFAPVPSEQSEDYLKQLVEGYQRGRSVPLPLFCKSGWVWLSTCMHKETGEIDCSDEIQSKAESQLLKVWLGDQGRRGEGDDPYVQRAFRQADKSFLAKLKQEALSYLLPIARYQNT